jgi:hypothetical protein
VFLSAINQRIDKFDVSEGLQEKALSDVSKSINLLIDATFFGREYGFLVFLRLPESDLFQRGKNRIG